MQYMQNALGRTNGPVSCVLSKRGLFLFTHPSVTLSHKAVFQQSLSTKSYWKRLLRGPRTPSCRLHEAASLVLHLQFPGPLCPSKPTSDPSPTSGLQGPSDSFQYTRGNLPRSSQVIPPHARIYLLFSNRFLSISKMARPFNRELCYCRSHSVILSCNHTI